VSHEAQKIQESLAVSHEAQKIRLVMELRQHGITDTRVLSAIERLPRDAFVPETFRDQAYENTALPIGHGQTISQPSVVGYMTQELHIGERMKVLEVGTGSGYQAAVLSRLCRRVYSVERDRTLLSEAEARFRALRLNNIVTRCADGSLGWPEQAPFERIIVTAAATDVPPALVEQLAPEGIMILPVGEKPDAQRLIKCRRTADGMDIDELWPVRFVPLVGGLADERQSSSARRRR
jgi:protein-L-isoaspartate(D-aspartate) O-methyltransferase